LYKQTLLGNGLARVGVCGAAIAGLVWFHSYPLRWPHHCSPL